jgi:hypothetical protein
MANITERLGKPAKIKPRVALFLKNVANGMVPGDAYILAGFKAKTPESACSAASRLLRYVNDTMPSRDLLNVMVPDHELFGVIKEKLLCSPDDVQVRAGSLLGKWKGLETPENAGLQGSTIVIVQGSPSSDQPAIDVTPQNDSDIPEEERKKLSR